MNDSFLRNFQFLYLSPLIIYQQTSQLTDKNRSINTLPKSKVIQFTYKKKKRKENKTMTPRFNVENLLKTSIMKNNN